MSVAFPRSKSWLSDLSLFAAGKELEEDTSTKGLPFTTLFRMSRVVELYMGTEGFIQFTVDYGPLRESF